MLHKIITRTMKLLTRRGVLVEEEGSTYMADNDGDSDEARVLRPLQAAAMLPYLATIAVLVLVSRNPVWIRVNVNRPASLGKPFHSGG